MRARRTPVNVFRLSENDDKRPPLSPRLIFPRTIDDNVCHPSRNFRDFPAHKSPVCPALKSEITIVLVRQTSTSINYDISRTGFVRLMRVTVPTRRGFAAFKKNISLKTSKNGLTTYVWSTVLCGSETADNLANRRPVGRHGATKII